MTTETTSLRQRIETAARTVPIRLGPNALAMAQRGEPIILNMGEAATLAGALLPLFAAEFRSAADDIDRETQRLKDDGVLEPDRFRPCRDAAEQLRYHADALHTGEGECAPSAVAAAGPS